jgi:large subunit ribosomal protein L25
MPDVNKLVASVRTEFGKGAARRTRRAGLVPAVLYGHQTQPQHLSVNAQEFAAILRRNGANAVLNLDIDGTSQLALTKSVVVHPIRRYIEHADLLVVKRGEKVTVEVAVVVTGDPFPGGLVNQENTTLSVEADALRIPEQLEISVEGAQVGTQFHASDIPLPKGVTLAGEPDALVVNIVAPAAEEPAAEQGETAEAAE